MLQQYVSTYEKPFFLSNWKVDRATITSYNIIYPIMHAVVRALGDLIFDEVPSSQNHCHVI